MIDLILVPRDNAPATTTALGPHVARAFLGERRLEAAAKKT